MFALRLLPALPLGLALLFLFLLPSCQKEATVPPEVKSRYQADAHRLCQSIVACLKADMEKQLEDPVQRAHVLERMTVDLCVQNQYRSIGSLSSNPGPGALISEPEVYESYSSCATAVAGADGCANRKLIHRSHPACQKLRELNI